MKEESVKREEWMRRGWEMNCCDQNIFFSLILFNFMAAKGLFDVNFGGDDY